MSRHKKQLVKRFEAEREAQPALSDWVCFVRAIRNQDYSESTIRRNFKKLVDTSDHVHSGLVGKIEYFMSITDPNDSEEPKND